MVDKSNVHQIGPFGIGVTLVACGGPISYLVFGFLTMKMSPALSGGEYWAAVWASVLGEPAISVYLVLGLASVLLGVILMGWAVAGRLRRRAKLGVVADGGA